MGTIQNTCRRTPCTSDWKFSSLRLNGSLTGPTHLTQNLILKISQTLTRIYWWQFLLLSDTLDYLIFSCAEGIKSICYVSHHQIIVIEICYWLAFHVRLIESHKKASPDYPLFYDIFHCGKSHKRFKLFTSIESISTPRAKLSDARINKIRAFITGTKW